MTLVQKQAWFNLAVVVASVLVVLALTPFLGRGALGGFGLLGFLGLVPLFVRHKGGGVVVDERDLEVSRRSLLAAYSCSGWCSSPPVRRCRCSTVGAGRSR